MDPYDWDSEEETDLTKRQIEEAQSVRANAYFNTFGSGDGAKVLEEWTNTFMFGVMPGVNATPRECAMRDGKQALIKLIVDQIQISQRGE